MKKVGFVSLGCPKNLVDSEVMMGQLKDQSEENRNLIFKKSPSETI
ncbi:hypothetical protein BH20ACI4_BH20ACI4_04790 [soil metagenome]